MKLMTRCVLVFALLLAGFCTNAGATVTVRRDSVLYTLPLDYHGVNVSAIWDNDVCSPGSRDALRRAGVKLMRFPGGVVANFYDWNSAANAVTPMRFWQYAKAAGAKAVFTTNAFGDLNGTVVSDSTAQNAANWVGFCRDSGISVDYWEIGNEPEFEATAPKNAYCDRFNGQQAAMRKVDSTITIMGPGDGGGFLLPFVAACSTTTDALSWHWYGGGTTWATTGGLAQTWQSQINTIRTYFRKPIFVSEWSVLSPTVAGVQGDWNLCVGPALATADCIGMFARTGVIGHTLFGCVHGVQDGWGLLASSIDDYNVLDTPSPTYFALALWSHMGNMPLAASATATARSQMAVYAHTKADSSVQVMLISKLAAAHSDTMSFFGFNPQGRRVYQYQLAAANGAPTDWDVLYNGVSDPLPAQSDLPAPVSLGLCGGPTFAFTVPPYSVTVFDFVDASSSRNGLLSKPTGLGAVVVRRVAAGSVEFSVATDSPQTVSVMVCAADGRALAALRQTPAANGRATFVWHRGNGTPGLYVARIRGCAEAGAVPFLVQ